MSKTVFFVPGAWMAPACWDDFRKPFEAAGYAVHTAAWPHLDGDPAGLRASPPEAVGGLSVGAVVDHYEALIKALPEKPIIVGHSFGGLYTQLLLDRGAGAAGIAIDPGPIAGAIPGGQTLLAALPPVLRLGGWRKPFTISREGFARNFANGNTPEVIEAAYDRLVVPTSGKIFYQAAVSIGTFANPKRRTVPLLITAADRDRTVTPFTSHASYSIQRLSKARTEFKLFRGHSHFLCGEPGWEDVAGFCLEWTRRNAS